MSLNTNQQYQPLISQMGYHVYIEDFSVWPILGLAEEDTVQCIVWEDISLPGVYDFSFMDNQKSFYSVPGSSYNIFIYAVKKWAGSASEGEVIWNDEKVWQANVETVIAPAENSSDWKEVAIDDLTPLNDVPVSLMNNTMYKASYMASGGNIELRKISDHTFTIRWVGDGNIISYQLADYTGVVIDNGDVNENNVEIVLEDDGVYYLRMTHEDETVHFVEIYDFTDSEKCYLNLMISTLCECDNCDCPTPTYTRALNFAVTYQFIRGMVDADQIRMAGLVDTQTLRSAYVSALGAALKKLAMLTIECTCKED